LPASTYPDAAAVQSFYAQLVERVAALPGVKSAGAVSSLPIQDGPGGMNDFVIEGRPQPGPGEQGWNAGQVAVTPGYFETMGIPVIAGRSIDARDGPDAPTIAVINEEAARLYWPNENPIGRRLRYGVAGAAEPQWITIVGLVENTRANGALEDVRPQIFLPHAQPSPYFVVRFMTIVVRAPGDPLGIAAAVNSAVREADSALAPIGGQSMQEIVNANLRQPRFTSQLATFFAVVALLLGALGIHGVLSYVVARRVGELGVRLALGARPAALLRLVVAQGMWLACIGVTLGVVVALVGARVLRGLLFGAAPSDPATFGIAIAVLGAAAFLACYGPGRRAAPNDPMTALRAE
jgi:predicted permease